MVEQRAPVEPSPTKIEADELEEDNTLEYPESQSG